MKPTEFIVENSIIAQEADDMHRDHEVQMARSQLYSAAQAAIQIHKLLKNVSEMEGLEGWVQTKIAVASEYLESVQDYLKYEAVSQEPEMMPFAEAAADYALNELISKKVKEQSPALPAEPTGHGQFTNKALPGGQSVTFDPATGSKTVSGGAGTTTSDVTGKPISYRSPSLDGTGTETNLATGEKTTNIQTGDMKVQSTTRPDQSTVTTATAPIGQYKVSQSTGIGFGGAGKDVQQGGNKVSSITDTGKEDQYLRQKWGGTNVDPRGKQVDPSQQSELNKLPAHTHSFAGRLPTQQELGSVVNEKSKKLKETASAGASGASGIATSMSGPAHKRSSGVPKKLGNAHKPKKITVGKGVY